MNLDQINIFSRIHSKPINIRWIRTSSHPYEKIMSSIVLYPVFYEYKMYNHKIKTILHPRNAVYNTMREITIIILRDVVHQFIVYCLIP